MKTISIFSSAAALLLGFSACKQDEGRYLNLTSGEEVTLVKDDEGHMVNKETGKPVLLYVDTEKKDTFYGITGDKVNGHLHRIDKGVYVYNDGDRQVKIDGDEYKIKSSDSKEKWDADGSEYKYKEGDVKVKVDEDDSKVKSKGYSTKVDEDGDVKIETKDKKIKVDGETGEREVKNKSIFSKVKDKVKGD